MRKHAFEKEDLIACGYGELFGEGNAQLPVGQMLMVDRILEINADKGNYKRGEVVAEMDIHPDLWFFKCHFPKDPVMPGCLGLDAMWQLVGFFLSWLGNPGHGRALGTGEVRFFGEVLPTAKKLSYHIHIRRLIERELTVGIANGSVTLDNKEIIYTATNLRVGLLKNKMSDLSSLNY